VKIPKQVPHTIPAIVEIVHTDGTAIEADAPNCSLLRQCQSGPTSLSATFDRLEQPMRVVVHEDLLGIFATGDAFKPVLHVDQTLK
jgi:hypothetical protein